MRGPLPGDARLALLMLAVGVAPAVLRRSRSLSRYLGDQFVRFGEQLRKDPETPAPTPPGTETPTEAAQPGVNQRDDANPATEARDDARPNDTTRAVPPGVPEELNPDQPYGQELNPHVAAELMGDGAASEPVEPRPAEPKPPEEGTLGTNPKDTGTSRPD